MFLTWCCVFDVGAVEAIDNNSLKSALQQCNKLLKKQPEALILKALKGLILERTGKTEEALKLCDQVKEKKPIDEPVLQALTMAYKSLGKYEKIVKIYENAILLNPNNEEIGNHWFMAMVRINDFKGQQQAALKLHKTFKSNKYLFWAIISLLLQAQSGPSRESDILLSLAERMMLKAVKEKGLKHIEAQKKYKEILEVLEDEELNNKCKDDVEVIRIRNDLLLKTENWTKANEISKNSLTETTKLIFGSKSCCFEDLQQYLKGIPLDLAKKIIEEFKSTINLLDDDKKSKITNIQKNVNIYKFERFLGLLEELSENEMLSYVNNLINLYKDALQYGKELLETEYQYGDDFIIIGSQILFDLYKKTDATQACYDSLPIYRSNEIEIQDFIEFQNELENSLQKVFIDREIIRLEFLNASKVAKNGITYLEELDVADLKYDDEYCENRRDNRDFAVLSNFNPINKPKFEEIIRVSPKLDLNWLKLFTLIPLILKNICVTKDIEVINSLTESLEKLLSQDYQKEKRLGDVIIKSSQLYLIIKEVQSGNKESISKIDAAMDNLINSLKVAEPEDISNHAIQELSWIHFHKFSLFLESQNIQNLNLTVKKHLQYLKKQLDIFKSIVEGEKSAPRIFEYIKSGSHIDFCSDEKTIGWQVYEI
ncbi:6068_t:CDS:10 [Diversispora eburnea]|uniref:6068_t:CDS:1 n=1 Tax=Diversispora eburnea TaxID=1213867 RepID=A0A9N8UZB7_9GLOM|nr:6068_t:CDS:10 [Diversispora eburnea]